MFFFLHIVICCHSANIFSALRTTHCHSDDILDQYRKRYWEYFIDAFIERRLSFPPSTTRHFTANCARQESLAIVGWTRSPSPRAVLVECSRVRTADRVVSCAVVTRVRFAPLYPFPLKLSSKKTTGDQSVRMGCGIGVIKYLLFIFNLVFSVSS